MDDVAPTGAAPRPGFLPPRRRRAPGTSPPGFVFLPATRGCGCSRRCRRSSRCCSPSSFAFLGCCSCRAWTRHSARRPAACPNGSRCRSACCSGRRPWRRARSWASGWRWRSPRRSSTSSRAASRPARGASRGAALARAARRDRGLAARRALLPGRGARGVPARARAPRRPAAVADARRARRGAPDDRPRAVAAGAALRGQAPLAPRLARREPRASAWPGSWALLVPFANLLLGPGPRHRAGRCSSSSSRTPGAPAPGPPRRARRGGRRREPRNASGRRPLQADAPRLALA